VGEPPVEGPGRQQRARVDPGGAQRVALAVAREGEQQRRDQRAEPGVVDVPLVHAVLAHGPPGVQRGDVRGGRARELGRELRDGALGEHAAQQRVLVGVALEEGPAERVEQDEDDALDRFRGGGDRRGRQAAVAAEQQPLDRGGQRGERMAVVQRAHVAAGTARPVDRRDRGAVERHA
jgi:hypothetical protein